MFWSIILSIESCANEKMGCPPRRTQSYTFPPLTQLVLVLSLSPRIKRLPGLHLYSHEFGVIWCDEKPCLYSSHFTHFRKWHELVSSTWEQAWQFSPLPGYLPVLLWPLEKYWADWQESIHVPSLLIQIIYFSEHLYNSCLAEFVFFDFIFKAVLD